MKDDSSIRALGGQPKDPVPRKLGAAPERQGLLILGMHRSGTSALTGILGKLGCTLPNDLLGPGIGNEKGHWEPQGIVDFNDRILASAGSHWEDWVAFNPDWYQSPLYLPTLQEARDALRVSFGNAPLFVLKDPRICRLTPFWLAAMEAEEINPHVVICIRDPADVAISLSSRDGMEYGYASLLWLRHVLDAEAASRGRTRSFCSFQQIMQNWRGVADRLSEETGISWPRKSASAYAEIDDFVSLGTDSSGKLPHGAMPEWVTRTHGILEQWIVQGENPADYEEIDEISKIFEMSGEVFSSLILPGSYSLGAGGGETLQAELKRQSGEYADRINALEGEAEQLKSELENKSQDHLRQEAETAAALGEFAREKDVLQAELDALRSQLEENRTASQQREDAYAAAEHRLGVSESTLRQREEEIEQTRSELKQLQNVLAEQEVLAATREAELAAMRDALEIARTKLEDTDAWVFKLAEQRQAAEADASSLQRRLAEVANQLGLTKAKIIRIEDERNRLSEERDEKAALARKFEVTAQQAVEKLRHLEAEKNQELAKMEQELAGRVRESATMTQLLASAENNASVAADRYRAAEVEVGSLRADRDEKDRERARLAQELAERVRESATMTQLLASAENNALVAADRHRAAEAEVGSLRHELSEISDRFRSTEAEVGSLRADRDEKDRERARLAQELAERVRESATMTQLLASAENSATLAAEQRAWLNEVSTWLVERRWWSILPTKIQRRRQYASLHRRGLFDAASYLQLYPDVAAEGMDPLRHYVIHGMAEGRRLTR